MTRCGACVAAVMLCGLPTLSLGQTQPPANPSGQTLPTAIPPTAIPPTATQPTNATQPAGSGINNLTGTARAKPKPTDPLAESAKRQSGLSESQALTLLSTKGYTQITNVQPEPNSIWVWQAEAMKDGRSVRLGIDYRGNILVLSSGLPTPCTTPGVNLGVGGFGVGQRLADVTACAAR
jgi:hypothetical protein